MKRATRTVGVVVVAMVISCLTGGCMGGISLFSSEHIHYEGRPGMDERMVVLEQKVMALEQAAPTNRVTSPRAPRD